MPKTDHAENDHADKIHFDTMSCRKRNSFYFSLINKSFILKNNIIYELISDTCAFVCPPVWLIDSHHMSYHGILNMLVCCNFICCSYFFDIICITLYFKEWPSAGWISYFGKSFYFSLINACFILRYCNLRVDFRHMCFCVSTCLIDWFLLES